MIKDWMRYLQMEYKDNLWKIIRYGVDDSSDKKNMSTLKRKYLYSK